MSIHNFIRALSVSVVAINVISASAFGALDKSKECGGLKVYGSDADYKLETDGNEIKVMNYNVENLFDAQHDDDRDDYEFLPINHPEKAKCDFVSSAYKKACKTTDWTEDKIDLKLSQIKRVVSVTGDLPDILTINEVENVNVVSRLADYLGYEKFLVTSGSDKRIQLALLYNENKIKLKETKEVQIKFPEEVRIKTTRNILIANFVSRQDSNRILGVYVNHWPSQGSPSGARVVAAQHIQKAIDANIAKYGDDYHVIASGDFNTIDDDSPHPFDTVILNSSWKNQLVDLHSVYVEGAYKKDSKNMISKMPAGSYFYGKDMTWNRLDRFFVTKNLLDNKGVEVQAQNYRIVAPSFLTQTFYDNFNKSDTYGSCMYGTPNRYEHNANSADRAGFSDHFGIVTSIKL